MFNPGVPGLNRAQRNNDRQVTATCPRVPFNNLSHTYESFLQDEWKPVHGLTLNLGVRYDRQTKIWNEDFDMSRYPKVLRHFCENCGIIFSIFTYGRETQDHHARRLGG